MFIVVVIKDGQLIDQNAIKKYNVNTASPVSEEHVHNQICQ